MGTVVIALGGNALLKRGEPMTEENQRRNARLAAEALAPLCLEHTAVVTHGNGPQVGLLALQQEGSDTPATLDVLGAQTEGAIGYMIEQELGNVLPFDKPIATILTMTEVDLDDPAFKNPTKFIGKVYSEEEAKKEADAKGWVVKQDGKYWRRVVASPEPKAKKAPRFSRVQAKRHSIKPGSGQVFPPGAFHRSRTSLAKALASAGAVPSPPAALRSKLGKSRATSLPKATWVS